MGLVNRLSAALRGRRLLFLSGACGLVLLLVVAALITARPVLAPGQPGGQDDPAILEHQAAALQPDFQADLEKLAEAPHYTLSAVVDPTEGSLSGSLMLDYTHTGKEPLSALVFRLYPNAGTIYGGGSLTVTQVQQGDEALLPELFEEDTALRVPLAQPLQPGQTISLNMDFTTQIPAGSGRGYGIFNRTSEMLSLAGWYPILAANLTDRNSAWEVPAVPTVGDALFAETSLYEVNLTLPAGYELVSTGTLVMTETLSAPSALAPTTPAAATARPAGRQATPASGQQWVTWQVISGPAREFTAAIAPDFETHETQVNGVSLRLHSLPGDQAALTHQEAVQIMAQAFRAFLDSFGPYPFNEFDVVEAPVTIGGYEFSGLVYVDNDTRLRSTAADFEYLVAHELAHQWWYGLVGNHTIEEPWLDEGHAAYAGVIYLEHAGRPESAQRLIDNWKQEAGERQPGDPPLNSSALEFKDWGVYSKAIYVSGALFLHDLRQELGDENFFALERRYQETYRYGTGSTTSYLSLAEEIAGRDLDPFFDKWFRTAHSGTISWLSSEPKLFFSNLND